MSPVVILTSRQKPSRSPSAHRSPRSAVTRVHPNPLEWLEMAEPQNGTDLAPKARRPAEDGCPAAVAARSGTVWRDLARFGGAAQPSPGPGPETTKQTRRTPEPLNP